MQNVFLAHGLSHRRAHSQLFLSSRPAGALLAIIALLFACPASLAQEGTVKAQHGDWQILCKDPPPGAKNKVCGATQSVSDEDNEGVGLSVYVQEFSTGERVLRVFAPLGILLPKGLRIRIDDQDFGEVPFMRCLVIGCQAQIALDDQVIEKMKTGKTAIFILYMTQEEGIGIPISLAGFSAALADLK